MHKNVKFCRKYFKMSFQLIHTQKFENGGKIQDSGEVIHIIHTQNPHLCELLLIKKERMFWLHMMKNDFCRKK